MSLVEPLTPCPVCVAPALLVDTGAVTRARVGERLAIPLVLANASTVERPLWVSRARARLGGGGFFPVDLPWERLGPGEERTFHVDSGALEAGGMGVLEVQLALGTRYRGYEERYLFGGAVRFAAEAEAAGSVVQNIDLSGAQFGTGGLVHVPTSLSGAERAGPQAASERVALPFARCERHEVELGLRGYAGTGQLVPRTVEFRFAGFPDQHAPARSAALGARGTLGFGRNLRRYDAERNADPSDVVLRILDPATGETDAEASTYISRRHFEMRVLDNRLCLHVLSANGVEVNGQRLAASTLHVLEDGDRIAPLAGRAEALALALGFETRPDGVVERIRIDRHPAAPGTAAAGTGAPRRAARG